ncbi:MAG: acylphosphatase [Thermoplasmatales archaeon]|nr:acylphosphatase [Thermoplasmatales archaeon]
MIRVKIVAEGKVQSAGYRDEVENIALELGIKGFVRNMEEKDRVEIVCESDEKVIDKFLKNVKIKNELIDVKKLTVKKTKPTGEFKTFKIIREDKDSEIAERMDEAVKHLKGMKKGLFAVKDEVKGSREDIKGVREEVKGSREDIKEMHKDMNKSFNNLNETIGNKFESMDVKYGDISKTMREMHNDLKEMKNLFAKLVNHIVKK